MNCSKVFRHLWRGPLDRIVAYNPKANVGRTAWFKVLLSQDGIAVAGERAFLALTDGSVHMRARSKLKSGQPGTRKLVEQYGDRLVCVRYRYDALKRRRYTTAEIIVDESDWDPMPSATARAGNGWPCGSKSAR